MALSTSSVILDSHWCGVQNMISQGYDVVTGGCGFIGSHLVDALLAQGRQVINIDIKRDAGSDIRAPIELPDKIERIFHLAALADIVPSITRPVQYYHTNVTGTLNVLEAARKAGCKKFIYAASASCYGDVPATPTYEFASINCKYPYALTKHMGEQLALHWSQVYKIPAISLRLFNVYGLRSRTHGAYGAMFGTFLAQMANEKPVTIVGDGKQKRDFIHVSDVVRAFIMAGDNDHQGVYNVGTGNPISINRIVEILGAKGKKHIRARPGEPDITCADTTKIKGDFGWEPYIHPVTGIAELLSNIHLWKEAPVWDEASIAAETKEWFACLS